jgi:hypothetical protein
VNATARFGELRVELLGPAGESLAKSKAIREEGLEIPVAWEQDVRKQLAGPTALRFTLKNARLFAVWATGA